MPTPKLGARPKSFKRPVTFGLIEGGEATIVCVFKYRTRKEFGELISRTFGKPEAQAAIDTATFAALLDLTTEQNVAYLLEVLDGWDLTDELTPPNVARLADEYPAAPIAIMAAYRLAIAEGRLGN